VPLRLYGDEWSGDENQGSHQPRGQLYCDDQPDPSLRRGPDAFGVTQRVAGLVVAAKRWPLFIDYGRV
jgi:hypothetical protein